jgi:TRAP-type C4-dicarboxylate transport system permease small subunit
MPPQAHIGLLSRLNQLVTCSINLLAQLNLWLIFPSLFILVLSDISLRYLFNNPLSWSHEILGLLLFCAFSLHLPYCFKENEVLRADLIYQYLSSQSRKYLNTLSAVLITSFAVILIYQGGLYGYEMYLYEEQAYHFAIPYWPFALLFTCCSGLIGCQSLLKLIAPYFE